MAKASKPLPKELREELDRNYIGVPKLSRLTGRSSRGLQYHINLGNLAHIKVDNPSSAGFKFMILKEDAVKFLEDRGEEIPYQLLTKQVESVHLPTTCNPGDSVLSDIQELLVRVKKIASENNYVDHCTLDLTKEKYQPKLLVPKVSTVVEKVSGLGNVTFSVAHKDPSSLPYRSE